MQRKAIDVDALIRMHVDEGMSALSLARMFQVDRNTITARLRERGITPRGRSDANRIRMQREGVEGRLRLTAAAHVAARGRKVSRAELRDRALGRERSPRMSKLELIFLRAFKRAGMNAVPQMAIGIFNADFAIPSMRIVVEIDPGTWHRTPRHIERDKRKNQAFRRAGWKVVRFTGAAVRTSNPRIESHAQELVGSLTDER